MALHRKAQSSMGVHCSRNLLLGCSVIVLLLVNLLSVHDSAVVSQPATIGPVPEFRAHTTPPLVSATTRESVVGVVTRAATANTAAQLEAADVGGSARLSRTAEVEAAATVEDEPAAGELDTNHFSQTYDPAAMPTTAVQVRYRPMGAAFAKCRIGKRRKPLYTLFDGRTRQSDVEPPITEARARGWIRGDKLPAIKNNEWPSTATPSSGAAREAHAVDDTATCMGRNAVIAAAIGYTEAHILLLTASFQQYAHACDELVLVRDSCSPLELERAPAPAVRCHQQGGMSHHSPERGRIDALAGWVRANADRYDYIIHVDARDTMFFNDPFAALYEYNVTGLFAAAEALKFSDWGSGMSRMWVGTYSSGSEHQDAAIVADIARLRLGGRPFPVICSGMYGGTSAAILDFLTAFSVAFKASSQHVQRTHAIDQGILIHLFTYGLAAKQFPHTIQLFDEDIGPYTHFVSREAPLFQSPNGALLNCDLRQYAIVHQLDRHEHLVKQLTVRFRHHNAFRLPNVEGANAVPCGTAEQNTHHSSVTPEGLWCKTPRNVRTLLTTIRDVVQPVAGLPQTSRLAVHKDDRTRCSSSSAIVALVTAPAALDALDALVTSFRRHYRGCGELHLIMCSGHSAALQRALERMWDRPDTRVLVTRCPGSASSLADRVALVKGYLAQHVHRSEFTAIVFSTPLSSFNDDGTSPTQLLFNRNFAPDIRDSPPHEVHLGAEQRPSGVGIATSLGVPTDAVHSCVSALMGGGTMGEGAVDDVAQFLIEPRHDHGDQAGCPTGLPPKNLLIGSGIVVGRPAAIVQYLDTALALASGAAKHCPLQLVLGFALPIALAARAAAEPGAPRLTARLWMSHDPHTLFATLRTGRTELQFPGDGSSVVNQYCVRPDGSHPHVPFVLFEPRHPMASRLKRQVSFDSRPSRTGDWPIAPYEPSFARSLRPFADSLNLRPGDELPFVAQFPNGTAAF
jgi:hypothetical protein